MHETYIRNAENDMEAAYSQAKELLSLPERPTAIFATSDLLALGILKAIRELKLRVPDDVAVLGFDDLDIADYVGLTTIGQALDESGRVASNSCLGALQNPIDRCNMCAFPKSNPAHDGLMTIIVLLHNRRQSGTVVLDRRLPK
ncbi:MAG: substrate-binding domain-containing protein [Caldilineaceae bacterium]